MPLTAAAGPISLAVERLVSTIANSTYFLTWTSEATVNDALGHIYRSSLPLPASNAETYTKAELVEYRPFVIVSASKGQTISFRRIATGSTYQTSGKLVAWFEQNRPADTDPDEVERLWENTLGKLLFQTTESDPFNGILNQADTDDRLTINACNVIDIHYSEEEEEVTRGAYDRAIIEFDWGIL